MDLEFKKKRRADTCDVKNCRTRRDITVREDGYKTCPRHSDGDSPPAQTAAAPPQGAAALPTESHVLALVEPVRADAEQNLAALAGATLQSQDQLDAAGAFLREVKGRMKKLEAQRTAVTKPLLDAKRGVDSWFRPAREALQALEAHLKSAIAAYVSDQERARIEALQSGDHEGALAVEQPELPSGVTTRTIWRFRVVDAGAVPRDFLAVDAAKIAQHVSVMKSQTAIPGIEVYPDTGVAARSES